MKKIKIMMMSLAVLAVIGGTLAFKARFQEKYCTQALQSGACPANAKCPNLLNNKTFTDVAADGTVFCTTVAFRYQPPVGDPVSTCFTDNNPAGNNTVVCDQTTTLKGD